MSTRTASATAILAVTAALVSAWPRPTAAAKPTVAVADTAPADTARASLPFTTGAELLRRFSGGSDEETRLSIGNTGILVATVPDPVASHLDWAFDTYLESIRRAYEAAGYTLDRAWLPWQERVDAKVPDVAPGAGEPLRDAFPGVLLFRAARPVPGRVLQLVYVVGEVPTSGVHRTALKRALAERDSLLSAGGDTADLPIVGPSFSGSIPSLVGVLGEWSRTSGRSDPSRTDVVRVLSGAATLASNPESFQLGYAGPRVTYGTTINDKARLTQALLVQVLCPLDIRPDQVLLLHESGTVYGTEAADEGAAADASCHGLRWSARGFRRIPFPMSIATLRAKLEDAPAAPAGEQEEVAARSRVRLSLRDPARPMDNLPVTSELTPASVEVLMNQIEDAASEHEVRAVGIVATDVRDKLFLAEEMRARLPDVTFFTFEANSLFLRPDKNRAFRGMLVLSTYPLTLQNQWWTAGSDDEVRQLLPFANEGAQGIYNATLMQLGAYGQLAEYRAPFGADSTLPPPVWVSVVGSRSFVPLAFTGGGEKAGTALVPVRPSERHLAFFSVIALLLLGLGLGYTGLSASRFAREESGRGHDGAEGDARLDDTGAPEGAALARTDANRLEDEVHWRSLRLHRHVYAFLRILALLSVFIPAALLAFTSLGDPAAAGNTLVWVFVAIGVAIAAGVLQALLLLAARATRPGTVATALVALGGGMGREVLRWTLVGIVGASSMLAAYTARGYVPLIVFLFICWAAAAAAAGFHATFAAADARARRKPWVRYVATLPPRNRWLWRGETLCRTLVLLAGVGYFGAAAVFGLSVFGAFAGPHFPILLDRLSRLDSGASPILLLALAGGGFAAWCTWHLERIELLRWVTPLEASARCAKRSSGFPGYLANPVARVRERMLLMIPNTRGMVLLGVLVVIVLLLQGRFHLTMERISGLRGFEVLLIAAVAGSVAATAWAVYRLLSVWVALRRVLEEVAKAPLLPAFRRLPRAAAQLTRLTLWERPSCEVVKTLAAEQWRQLVTIYKSGSLSHAPAGAGRDPAPRAEAEKLQFVAVYEPEGGGGERTALEAEPKPEFPKKLQLAAIFGPGDAGLPASAPGHDDASPAFPAAVADIVTTLMTDPERDGGRHKCAVGAADPGPLPELSQVLAAIWKTEPDQGMMAKLDALGGAEKSDTGSLFRASFRTPARLWLRAAEEFVAVQVVDYVAWVMQQMRALALFVFVSLVVTLALLDSYPFQPQGEVKLVYTFVIMAAVAALLYVMVSMNRNEVLSHVADTDPGRVSWSWGFAMNVGLVTVVPLLGLAGSRVPWLHTVLFSWLQPLLNAVVRGG